jgi:hypothetical protein
LPGTFSPFDAAAPADSFAVGRLAQPPAVAIDDSGVPVGSAARDSVARAAQHDALASLEARWSKIVSVMSSAVVARVRSFNEARWPHRDDWTTSTSSSVADVWV